MSVKGILSVVNFVALCVFNKPSVLKPLAGEKGTSLYSVHVSQR